MLPAAVADFLQGRACELTWGDVIHLLLPGDSTITASELYRVLNVSCLHLYNLVKAKNLFCCSSWRRGRGGQARFEVSPLIDFLHSRRFP